VNPRERFLTALLCRGEPDRVPLVDTVYSPNLFRHVLGHCPDHEDGEAFARMALALEFDAVRVHYGVYSSVRMRSIPGDEWVDEWGTTYRRTAGSWPGDTEIAYPIRDRSDLAHYRPPDPDDAGYLEALKAARAVTGGELAVIGSVVGPFSQAWAIVGPQGLMLSFYDDPEFARELLRLGTEFNLQAGRRMIEMGVDAIHLGDDYGANVGPLISPAHFKRFVLPFLREMVHRFQAWSCPVILHSDGNIKPLLKEIGRTGVRCLNPIQRSANMDLKELKGRLGGRMSLWGGIDSTHVLPSGTPDQVEEHTRECLRTAGPGGGYLCGSDHSLRDDMPLENMLRMVETVKRYGQYPIA
jgi:uroporphyrinogen decarboxylase